MRSTLDERAATVTTAADRERPARREWIALAGAGGLAALAAPALVGPFEPRIGAKIIPALAIGAAVVWLGPRAAARLRWGALLLVVFVASVAWAVALAASDGAGALTAPVSRPSEYLATAEAVSSPAAFLESFVERIDEFPIHVRGHPPGLTLLLWGIGRVGLDGAAWAAALMIAVGCSAACAALVAVRDVAGEDTARVASPFLVLMPAAVWIATSADALFMGVAAWGVAAVVIAAGRRGRTSDAFALGGGVALGLALYLTYGALPLLAVPAAVLVARGARRPALAASIGGAAVVIGFAAAGFWWLDGFLATRREYLAGVAGERGYWFFLVANLGAFALAIGPAAVAGLTKLRSIGLSPLLAGAIAAVALADVSGMSKGEVERIWLLFVPWIAPAAAAATRYRPRAWLTATALTGLTVQSLLRSPW